MATKHLTYVFSIRSPYAWLATRGVVPRVGSDVEIDWVPFLPLPGFENFETPIVPAKATHNLQDILRFAKFFELRVGRPPVDEPEWKPAHTAFLRAKDLGRGAEFAIEMTRMRWEEGLRVSGLDAIGVAAERVGLEPEEVREAAVDPEQQTALCDLVRQNYDEAGIFGVPMFVLPSGERFWGQDRLLWALEQGYI
ncbi:MAG: DsbA family protein [Myxococcota bacterium]